MSVAYALFLTAEEFFMSGLLCLGIIIPPPSHRSFLSVSFECLLLTDGCGATDAGNHSAALNMVLMQVSTMAPSGHDG